LDVQLVVFTDNTDERQHAATAASLQHLRIEHRYVGHYGWPVLALRRWETYLDAEHLLREADVAFHIDCDARVVGSLLPLLLSSPSFGVLHADNAYYSGHEVYGFDPATWRPHRTRELNGFLGLPRQQRRGYMDQACFPKFCLTDPPYELTVEQRCGMTGDEGEYYFYSGFFGGSGAWMMRALITLQQWTAHDWAKGYMGARVDDESYLNRLFWEQPPGTVLTSAFMYPEPPADISHPWLWTNFGAEQGRVAEGGGAHMPYTEDTQGKDIPHLTDGTGPGGWDRWRSNGGGGSESGEAWETREWQAAFSRRVLQGDACRHLLQTVSRVEEYGRGGVREAGQWHGVGEAGFCWNVTGATRWFKPVVLNLSKDKRALFEGSDKSRFLGLHEETHQQRHARETLEL